MLSNQSFDLRQHSSFHLSRLECRSFISAVVMLLCAYRAFIDASSATEVLPLSCASRHQVNRVHEPGWTLAPISSIAKCRVGVQVEYEFPGFGGHYITVAGGDGSLSVKFREQRCHTFWIYLRVSCCSGNNATIVTISLLKEGSRCSGSKCIRLAFQTLPTTEHITC
jgi:hypothetical protein